MAVTCKTDGGKCYPASDYAYVPDPESPSTWKLRLTSTPGGDPDPGIVGAAVAALGPGGFRGNRVQIPAADLPKVKAKVRAAWKKANPDKSADEMPATIKLSAEEIRVFINRTHELVGEVETFDLKKLNTALDNINEVINDLDRENPNVSSALTNARDAKKAIQAAIDVYSGGSSRKIVVVRPPGNPPPPPPPPPPTMGLEEETVE